VRANKVTEEQAVRLDLAMSLGTQIDDHEVPKPANARKMIRHDAPAPQQGRAEPARPPVEVRSLFFFLNFFFPLVWLRV
jgi:hypothetical protein